MPEKMPENTELPEEMLAPGDKAKMEESQEAFYKWLFENGENPELIENPELAPEENPDERNPFEKHWDEGVKKIKDKYLGVEINEEEKGEIEGVIEKDEENAKLEYAKEWLKDNESDVVKKYQEKYPDATEIEEERLLTFAMTEMGEGEDPFSQMENNKDVQKKYETHVDKMADLYILHEGMKKNHPTPEIQFLALNHFYEKTKKAAAELRKEETDLFGPESPGKIENAKKEWLKQSRIVKELTAKINGENPQEKAQKETDAMAVRERKGFISSQLKGIEERKIRQHNEILKGLTDKDLSNAIAGAPDARREKIDISKNFVLKSKVGELTRDQVIAIVGTYGVNELRNIRHKNWLSNKIIIGGQEIKSENLNEFLAQKKKELDNKMRAREESAAELKWKRKTKGDTARRMNEIIKNTASPENAKTVIKEKYERIKKELEEKWDEEEAARKAEKKPKPEEEKKAEKEPEKETKEKLDAITSILELSLKDPDSAIEYLKNHTTEIRGALKMGKIEMDEKELLKYADNPKKLPGFLKGCLTVMVNIV